MAEYNKPPMFRFVEHALVAQFPFLKITTVSILSYQPLILFCQFRDTGSHFGGLDVKAIGLHDSAGVLLVCFTQFWRHCDHTGQQCPGNFGGHMYEIKTRDSYRWNVILYPAGMSPCIFAVFFTLAVTYQHTSQE